MNSNNRRGKWRSGKLGVLAERNVNRGRGGYYLLQRDGAVDRAVPDIDIFEAKTVPPASGRYRQAG